LGQRIIKVVVDIISFENLHSAYVLPRGGSSLKFVGDWPVECVNRKCRCS